MSAFPDRAWQTVLRKITSNAGRGFTEYPLYTDPTSGVWVTADAGESASFQDGKWRHGNWMAGFWPGLLWLAHARTGEDRYASWAREALAPFEERATDPNTHDIGFLFYPSFVVGFRQTGEERLRAVALRAADTLLTRFNPQAGYIQAWGPIGHAELGGTSTIDTMMNLYLLWWAYEETKETRYWDVATMHAEASQTNLVRDDSSTVHLGIYDPETGELKERRTFQGYSGESCWTRGQSWGICGYARAAAVTGSQAFADTAVRLADYFLKLLPATRIPPWDFDDPDASAGPLDSSAAAAAAYGLLRLAEIDSAASERYQKEAEAIMAALTDACVDHEDRSQGILLHGCYSKPQNEGTDSALIFGDYFYAATLYRMTEGKFA
jgi:unsaturated chondroitin disaccharide hydrolase